jgi:hypothetical protein
MRDGRIIARSFTGFFDAAPISGCHPTPCQMHRPFARPLFDPERAANVFYASSPTARPRRPCAASASPASISRSSARWTRARGRRHGPDRVPHPQRLSRRRHEGASAHGEECRADRMLPGGRWQGWMADAPDHAQASSLIGGGAGERATIPETATDQIGRIGERRRENLPTAPYAGSTARGRVAAGAAKQAVVAAPPQHEDMAVDLARFGFSKPEAHATRQPQPAVPPASPSPPRPPQPAPSAPRSSPPVPPPAPPQPPASAPRAPQAAEQGQGYRPEEPFKASNGRAYPASSPARGGAGAAWRRSTIPSA